MVVFLVVFIKNEIRFRQALRRYEEKEREEEREFWAAVEKAKNDEKSN